MLQDLTRSAILVTALPRVARGRRRAAAVAVRPVAALAAAAATTTGPDLDERSPAFLAELADLAYRAGDRASAEYFVRRLYAAHDRRAAKGAAAEDGQAAA